MIRELLSDYLSLKRAVSKWEEISRRYLTLNMKIRVEPETDFARPKMIPDIRSKRKTFLSVFLKFTNYVL